MRKLTSTDAKILSDLLIDGRKSLTQIADECGETKATISKRFIEMEKTGVIIGSTIQLDYAKLGYTTVGNITVQALPENIDNLISNIKKTPTIYGAWKQNKNTVYAVATLRDINELNRVKERIIREPFVTNVIIDIWTGIRNIPYNLSVFGSLTQLPKKNMNNDPINIDVVDRQIIELLAKNGRAPFASIAKEIGISTNTVIRKYERLKQNGVICTSIQINPAMLGYQGDIFFNLACQSHNSFSVVDKLSSIPDIVLIIKTSGQYDLRVFSIVKDIGQIVSLKEAIFEAANILKFQMSVEKLRTHLPYYKEYISTF